MEGDFDSLCLKNGKEGLACCLDDYSRGLATTTTAAAVLSPLPQAAHHLHKEPSRYL